MLSSGVHHLWHLRHIFPSLRLAFPESLLHNLQDLRWYHHHVFNFLHISIFLRPSLTRISFHLSTASHPSILLGIGERCPNLADISITADPGVDLQPLSSFVARLPFAKSLCVPWLGPDALQHLSTLATLESLTLGKIAETLAADAAATTPAFAALRHLDIDEGTVADTTRFLLMCRDVPLETLRVRRPSRRYPSVADLNSFFTVLAGRVSHSTLRMLSLNGNGWLSETADPQAFNLIPPNTLAPLLCFKNMTSLIIICTCVFDLDDDSVSRMARAWPQIQRLCLAGTLRSADRPRATLASLYSIARHCPRIFALAIAFDGSDVPSPLRPVRVTKAYAT
ncbi:hypothetical protein DFH06DRAFT_1149536 [Mycena polygramma]|nr:hypothetical protein DFH06DRAFT_1149536 [Mycena polygramma]